jgi:hypothetical protein
MYFGRIMGYFQNLWQFFKKFQLHFYEIPIFVFYFWNFPCIHFMTFVEGVMEGRKPRYKSNFNTLKIPLCTLFKIPISLYLKIRIQIKITIQKNVYKTQLSCLIYQSTLNTHKLEKYLMQYFLNWNSICKKLFHLQYSNIFSSAYIFLEQLLEKVTNLVLRGIFSERVQGVIKLKNRFPWNFAQWKRGP